MSCQRYCPKYCRNCRYYRNPNVDAYSMEYCDVEQNPRAYTPRRNGIGHMEYYATPYLVDVYRDMTTKATPDHRDIEKFRLNVDVMCPFFEERRDWWYRIFGGVK